MANLLLYFILYEGKRIDGRKPNAIRHAVTYTANKD